MKNYKRLGILVSALLLSFAMVACGDKEKGNSCISGGMPPTQPVVLTPTATAAPGGETPTPAPTSTATLNRMPKRRVEKVDPDAEQITIDEKYFSDEAFRLFLGENYDTDKDGFLSKQEREQVTELDDPGSYGSGKVVIDGLDWFPNVERLEMMGEAELHLDHHPGVVSVNWNEMGTSMLYVDGCDRLETIAVHMGCGAGVYVKDCDLLKRFTSWDGYLGSLYMSKVPELELCVDWYEELPKEIWLDDDAQILWRLWSDTEEPIRSDDMGVRFEVKENGILYWDEVFDDRYEVAVNWLGVKVGELDLQEQVNQMYAMYRESVKDGQSENDTTQAVVKTIRFSPRKTSAYVVGEWAETGKLMTARYYILTSDGTITEYASLEEMRAAAERVAISEGNFGDARFCEFLKEQFDTDGDGFFSDEELGAVRRIDFGTKYIQSPITEIKGFSYFPYLEYLTLNSAQKINVCGVQNLSEIRMDRKMGSLKYRVGDLNIADCPKLRTVDINETMFIGRSENEVGELRITNCPVLRDIYVWASQADKVGIRITETPTAKLLFFTSEDETEPAYFVLDTNLYQNVYLPVYDVKNGTLVYPEQGKVEWVGAAPTSFDAELAELNKLTASLREGFLFEVQEVQPPLRDEEGRTAYVVHLDNEHLSDWNYHFYALGMEQTGFRQGCEYYGTAALVFSKEPLNADNFSIEWKEPLQITTRNYSPVRGWEVDFYNAAWSECIGNVMCRAEGRKEVLGELNVSMNCSVGKEDGFEFWTDVEYEDGAYINVTEGVWLEENPAGDILPEKDALPITEDNFTSLLFRELLKETVDTDRNGFLSLEEREAVTSLSSAHGYGIGPVVVDGLEHFPNLKFLSLPECGEVVAKNCPKLEIIGLNWCDKLICQNCPELREIEISGDGTAEVVTEGCPKITSIITDEGDICHCEDE